MRIRTLMPFAAVLLAAACEVPMTVTDPDFGVVSVTVVPKTITLSVGDSLQLSATVLMSNNRPPRSVSWTSSNVNYATVNTSGMVYGVGAGDVFIFATSGSKRDSAAVTVVPKNQPPPPPVASVEVTPTSATIQVGQTVQLTATPKDSNGNPLAGRTVTWSSDNTGVASVSGSGLVTGLSAGSATITGTSEGKSGTSAISVTAPPPPPPSAVLVGAGDIASCSSSGDEATATLLDGIAGTVFTAGDNAYDNGSSTDYSNCYDPSWGRHKARTRPSPGNHEYYTPGAASYFHYFGPLAGDSGKGYYSFDLGDWHVISLNSNISMSAGSTQETWLRQDLAASTKQCTLAYWHHPRFSSGTTHGSEAATQPLWQALYDYGAEIVISGHEHNYERFAPQTPTGVVDPVQGIREFVVGTGGKEHYNDLGTPLPNSEVFNGTTFGVLKLTLSAGSYTWEFIPEAGGMFTDSGSGTCH